MDAAMTRKLKCDVCEKLYTTLGNYGDKEWWLCFKCFAKADALAAKANRWPDERDFRMVKRTFQKERNE
jgi:hypothetical protein